MRDAADRAKINQRYQELVERCTDLLLKIPSDVREKADYHEHLLIFAMMAIAEIQLKIEGEIK